MEVLWSIVNNFGGHRIVSDFMAGCKHECVECFEQPLWPFADLSGGQVV